MHKTWRANVRVWTDTRSSSDRPAKRGTSAILYLHFVFILFTFLPCVLGIDLGVAQVADEAVDGGSGVGVVE